MLNNRKFHLIIFIILSIIFFIFGDLQLNISSTGNNYYIYISISIISIVLFLYLLLINKIAINSEPVKSEYSPGRIIECISVIIDFIAVMVLSIVPTATIILVLEFISTSTFQISFTRDYFVSRDVLSIILTIVAFIFIFLLGTSSVRTGRRSIGQYLMGIYLEKEYKLSKLQSFLRIMIGMFTFPFWLFNIRKKQLLHNRIYKISVIVDKS